MRRFLRAFLRAPGMRVKAAWTIGAGAAIVLLLVPPKPAAAQEPVLFLAPDHWAHAALDRLGALGLTPPGSGTSGGSLVRAAVLQGFGRAADSAAARGAAWAEALAKAYLARLEQENASPRSAPLVLAAGDVGGRVHRGAVHAGYDRDELHVAPSPLSSRASVTGETTLALRLRGRAAAELRAEWSAEDATITTAYAGLPAGPFSLWAGRRAIGFRGPGARSLVLQGDVPFDGAGAVLLPVTGLPGMLRLLGSIRAETFFARLHVSGGVAHPWFWAARVEVEPTPRLAIAVSRAAVFGGAGNSSVGLAELPILLVGLAGGAHGETENQVASLAVHWRPPSGALPLQLYGEWAFDDMGLSYFHVPGLLLGAALPAAPFAPGIALGVDWTRFAGHCCGNPPWYRHSALPWLDRRQPLGHPLGGNGTELRAYGRADGIGGMADVQVEILRRDRGPENLFSPLREGVSRGAALEARLRIGGRLEPHLRSGIEAGRGWREWTVEVGTRVLH